MATCTRRVWIEPLLRKAMPCHHLEQYGLRGLAMMKIEALLASTEAEPRAVGEVWRQRLSSSCAAGAAVPATVAGYSNPGRFLLRSTRPLRGSVFNRLMVYDIFLANVEYRSSHSRCFQISCVTLRLLINCSIALVSAVPIRRFYRGQACWWICSRAYPALWNSWGSFEHGYDSYPRCLPE